MINIALADNNPIFCQGLKTMLAQVEDFMIFVLPPDALGMQQGDEFPADILLVDADLYHSVQGQGSGRVLPVPEGRTILLTMESDELPGGTGQVIAIQKGCGKGDFVAMIRKVTAAAIADPILNLP